MKYKKGDKVRFLNDVGGGTITGFRDEKIVNVQIEDGFEIPVLISEIVMDTNQDQAGFDEKAVFGLKETVIDEPKVNSVNKASDSFISLNNEDKLYIAMVPSEVLNGQVKMMKLYLINDTDYMVFFVLGIKKEKHTVCFKTGSLEDNTKLLLGNISFYQLLEMKVLNLQLILYHQENYEGIEPISRDIVMGDLYADHLKSYKENDFFDEPAIICSMEFFDMEKEVLKLTSAKLQTVMKEKDPPRRVRAGDFFKNTSKAKPQTEEIDLHIEEILENTKDLSPGEILDAQMARFETALKGAILSGVKKIVFIHGIGNGRLKYEISKTLDRKYPDLKYQDASFKEYGYGATMVILK